MIEMFFGKSEVYSIIMKKSKKIKETFNDVITLELKKDIRNMKDIIDSSYQR
ncbi:MAG: hypothetical protein ACI4SR_10080 [Faecalibacillus sp.]